MSYWRQPGSGVRWVQDAPGDRRQVDRLGPVQRRGSVALGAAEPPLRLTPGDILAAACGDAPGRGNRIGRC